MAPFVDLKAQYLSIKDEIDAAIARLLESSQFVCGTRWQPFRKSLLPTAVLVSENAVHRLHEMWISGLWA